MNNKIIKKKVSPYKGVKNRYSIESIKKMSEANTGKKNPMYGKKANKNQLKGLEIGWNNKFGKNNPQWKGGKPKCKVCGKQLKHYFSILCMSCSKKGKKNPMYGQNGNLHPNWQDGKSFEPYSVDWTETLRKSIRQRDKYTCQICEKEPAVCVHHIDYDKKNNNPDNLITLCRSCHTKTNFNRENWINHFKNK